MPRQPVRLFSVGLTAILCVLAASTLAAGARTDDISPWTGHMKEGDSYRTPIVYQNGGLWWPVGLEIPYHHGLRVEWENIEGFPEIQGRQKTGAQMMWTFRVLSKQVRKVANRNQWRTTYTCRILDAEPIEETEK